MISDTSPEAAEVQLEILRKMTGEQRIQIAFELSDFMRRAALSRIRAEHPDWIRLEVIREWVRLCFLPEPMPAWLEERFREDITAEKRLPRD